MREITRIHLARTPFNIEIDAKKALEKYLSAVQGSLGNDDDTMREIEARIVEILVERSITGERVITTGDVKAIETRLGAPSDFASEDEQEIIKQVTTEKRLMRNTDRGLLGGVCAGIADYFGINVIWPRLVAVLLLLVSFGTAALIYVVLWLAVPAAKTAAEKLQMRGEPVTLAALKLEASEKVSKTPERSKPLVMLLRVVLGALFTVMGAGAIVFMIVAIFVREPLFASSLHDLTTSGVASVLGAAYIAAMIAGLLFIALMFMLAYASFAWTVNRKMFIGAIVIVVLGLSSFVAAASLGFNGVSQIHQQIEAQRTTETLSSIHLDTSQKRLTFVSNDVPVEYHVSNATAHVDIEYLRSQQKPSVTVNAGVIEVSRTGECMGMFGGNCFGFEKVIIYGPALDQVTLQKGQMTYFANSQSRLAVDVKSDVSMTVNGAVDTLVLTAPKLCGGNAASLQYDSANLVTLNGKQITQPDDNTSCLTLN